MDFPAGATAANFTIGNTADLQRWHATGTLPAPTAPQPAPAVA